MLQYARQIVLRDGKHHGDWIDLRDHHQAHRIRLADDIAGIKLAQAKPAADWRGDARIAQLQTRVIDLRLIDFDGAFKLFDLGFLCVELLLGNGVLREQGAVALKVEPRIGKLRLIAR